MENTWLNRVILALGIFLGAFLGVKYLLPLFFPFFLGFGIALCAQPAVKLGKKWGMPAGLCSAFGVSFTLLLLLGLVTLALAIAAKELGQLVQQVPRAIEEGAQVVENWLVQLSANAPEAVQPMLTDTVHGLFGREQGLLRQAAGQLPGFLGSIAQKLPGSAMTLGTGVISAYLLSPRLGKLSAWVRRHLPAPVKEKLLPTLTVLRSALGSWLKAQGILMSITFAVVCAGFLLLGIPYAPLSAAGVALVDAVPLLGTGAVLLPWALVSLLQGAHLRAIGLLCIYGAAAMTRTVMEPRLVGKKLGLDPLVMLMYFYLGLKFLGFWGMVLSPLLAAATKVLTTKPR